MRKFYPNVPKLGNQIHIRSMCNIFIHYPGRYLPDIPQEVKDSYH